MSKKETTTDGSIQAKYLRALLLLAGKNDVRYYLNGVYIERQKAYTYLVASDGHRIGAVRIDALPFKESIIIPRDALKSALLKKDEFVKLEKFGDRWAIGGVLFEPIDGKFPDWRKVLPKTVSRQRGQFNGQYLYELVRVGRIVSLSHQNKYSYTIVHNGEGAAIATFDDPNFVVAIMPMRDYGPHTCWHTYEVKEPESEAEPA